MADDAERAAKAARAKAMLKKRQQQKAGVPPSPSPAPAVHKSPLAHPLSPPPQSPERKDVSTLFGDSGGSAVDFGEFGVLSPARGAVYLSPVSSPPPASAHNGDAVPASAELRTLVTNQQQTINLLVGEKASLSSHLERLEDLESKYSENESSLEQERKRAESLSGRLKHVEEQAKVVEARLEEAEHRERVVVEKSREQERELEHTRRNAGELKTQLESRELELRALKEQVEADDRVETLERSLKATQDRTEELEFQLSKVRQNNTSSVQERDALTEKLASLTASVTQWAHKHSTLEQEHASVQHELGALSSSLGASERARNDLQSQLSASEASLSSVQQQFAHAISELASHSRQLHGAQSELVFAQRRAEDAEQAQRSLQAENSTLLAQLEEVRPKVVELSNRSAEDAERIWDAEKKIHALEKEVVRLEAEVDERAAAAEEARKHAEAVEAQKTREEQQHHGDLREVQEAHAALVREVEQAKAHTDKLEKEISEHRAGSHTRERDLIHWKTRAETSQGELESVRSELSARRNAEGETLAVVERAQAEVESLRDQLALREDEIARLREGDAISSASSHPHSPKHDRQPSLNDEMLSAVRQQHALDLSTAHSRIRALESEVFDAQASAHNFQRRVTALEDELAQLRTRASPDIPRRATPLARRASDDSRRHSLSSTRPHTPSSLRSHTPSSLRPLIAARAVYDANLTAETRHKRKASLTMLKARIESERAAAQHAAMMGSPLTRVLSSTSIAEGDESGGAQTPRRSSDGRAQSVLSETPSHDHVGKHTPHFLDEWHVLWCHACRGDLVVL